jgi:hypothetical protein
MAAAQLVAVAVVSRPERRITPAPGSGRHAVADRLDPVHKNRDDALGCCHEAVTAAPEIVRVNPTVCGATEW